MPLCFIEPQDAIRVVAESIGREARRQLVGEVVRAWVDEIKRLSGARRPYLESCTPGYYTGEGDIDKGLLVDSYAPGPIEFSRVMRAWCDNGRPGVELS